jgi:CheY-like chemotaxis protein
MKQILVIDDNDQIRLFLATVLAEYGFYVRQANDGQAALRSIEAATPDLIISDVEMPCLDGYGVLEAVRDMPHTAAVPFILMTGAASNEGFRRGMVSGADDYLSKPFTATDIVEAVLSRMARQADWQMDAYDRLSNGYLQRNEHLRMDGNRNATGHWRRCN